MAAEETTSTLDAGPPERQARQTALEGARVHAHLVSAWLATLDRAYLRKDERAEIVSAIDDLARIACSATCDAEAAWLEGYMVGRDDEKKGVDI